MMTVDPSKLITINSDDRFLFFKNSLSSFFKYLYESYPTAIKIFRRHIKILESVNRKQLDIQFLETCIDEHIIPSFIFKSKLHECLSSEDVRRIHRRILRRMLEVENKRLDNLTKQLALINTALYNVSDVDCFHLCFAISENISKKACNDKIVTQNKKLNNLRRIFGVFKFDLQNTILNLSDSPLSNEEIAILKFGPKH